MNFTIVVIWLFSLVVVFLAGIFVHRNNAKRFERLIDQVELLPNEAKEVLRKYKIEVK